MQTRQISPSAGATCSWNLTLDNNPVLHASATVADLGAGTSKVWTFGTAGPFVGLSATYEERASNGTALLHKDYTWANDNNNLYVGSVLTTLNPRGASSAYSALATTLTPGPECSS